MSASPTQWYPPPETPVLNGSKVDVWRASLDLPASHLKSLWQILSGDEHQRADRFVCQTDRDKFIAARGLLRMILGRYLDVKPGELHFCYGPKGKPELSTKHQQICFNVSHSGELVLYAIAVSQVGIDLERVRTDLDCLTIAQRYFSPQETSVLLALPPDCRHQAFFQIWTCKEAYIKATGGAVFQALNQVEVSLAPAEATAYLRINRDPQAALSWSLRVFNPGPNYVAALAIKAQGYQVKYWLWPE